MRHLVVRRCVIAAGWVWLLLAVPAMFAPNEDYAPFVIAVCLFGLVIAIAWLGYSIANPDIFRSRWRTLSWLCVPTMPILAILLSVLLSLLPWTTALQVWLCEDELKAHAERVLAEPEPEYPWEHGKRIGLFNVKMSTKWDGNVQMQTRGIAGHGGGGIIYAPNGIRHDPNYPNRARHLYGPWYEWGSRF